MKYITNIKSFLLEQDNSNISIIAKIQTTINEFVEKLKEINIDNDLIATLIQRTNDLIGSIKNLGKTYPDIIVEKEHVLYNYCDISTMIRDLDSTMCKKMEDSSSIIAFKDKNDFEDKMLNMHDVLQKIFDEIKDVNNN